MVKNAEDQGGEVTILTPATTVSNSLRSTIPSAIVRQFKLSKGDKLRWRMEVANNQLIIIVEPVRIEKKGR
jgi:antitoxin component of MazEF toxin-antitoxin module